MPTQRMETEFMCLRQSGASRPSFTHCYCALSMTLISSPACVQKLEKVIPDAAGTPVHLRPSPIFAHTPVMSGMLPDYLEKKRQEKEAAAKATE